MQSYLTREAISAWNLHRAHTFSDCGAVVSFEGVVRDHHEGRGVKYLEYEAYAPMAEKMLADIKAGVEREWPVCRVAAVHRIGRLDIGEVAVAIVAWAPHRAEAFAACSAVIEGIKIRLPVWKKEFYTDGSTAWVMCAHSGGGHAV